MLRLKRGLERLFGIRIDVDPDDLVELLEAADIPYFTSYKELIEHLKEEMYAQSDDVLMSIITSIADQELYIFHGNWKEYGEVYIAVWEYDIERYREALKEALSSKHEIDINNIEYILLHNKRFQVAIEINGKILKIPHSWKVRHIVRKIVRAHKIGDIQKERFYKEKLIRLVIRHHHRSSLKLFKNSFIKGNISYL